MWENSKCKRVGWLHNFRHYRTIGEWEIEKCERCQQLAVFSAKTPNHVYLSHHLRETLQRSNPRFKKEYAQLS